MKESFVHLHVHSHYSMMWGVSPVKTLCRKAAEAGNEYLALTDTNGLYGLIRFLEAARQYGIQPIVGANLQTHHSSLVTRHSSLVTQIVVLAKTPKGYELLTELLSQRHLDKDFSLLRSFPRAPEDLAVLSSDPDIIKALRSRAQCWVEAVPGPAGRQALKLAALLGVPPLATNAVYFAHPDDYSLHRLVRAIDGNRTLSTLPPEELVQPGQWLKTGEAMARHFPDSPEALANTMKLAGSCHTAWDHFHMVFPHYEGQTDDHLALLLEACRKGILRRYGESNGNLEKRLAEELDLIHTKGYVDYFLVVADIVRRRPIHCGRGSAAASLVSYLLGITHVDPIRHRLLFGRFLNPQRKDPPDIDVDFPWDERDALHEELRQYYGPERMAAVANHVGFGARAAVREVAKVYGIPAAEIKEVTRRMSFYTDPEDILRRVETHPKFRGYPLDPPWPEIISRASRLQSLPRHLATHCGGVILAPDRVSRYVPVERSAKGIHIIQWEKDQTETAGLVKIDLLGNRSLAVIRDALAAIRKNTEKIIDYASLNPVDDPATLDLLARGDTMGIFYVESPAMRQLQQRTGRGDFEHLVIHSSIIRPAANRYIHEYIRRLHGAPYQPLHPSLKELLAETYGILVYQEDVVRVAMALAGFNWGEADGLRKVISKKSPEQLSDYRRRFVEGCRRRGIADEVVKTAWDMFLSFSGYSFCKPHSASYALVSFKSAYLKVHYPAEFMAAVISNGGGYYSTLAYLSEARRMGIAVLGPDLNESDWNYRGDGKTIRIGLQQLQNIRHDMVRTLLDERCKNGPFLSLDDFLRRVKPTPADGSVLVKSGALDSLAGTPYPLPQAPRANSQEPSFRLNRPQLLWFVEAWLSGNSASRIGEKQTGMVFFSHSRAVSAVPPLPDLSPERKWQQEIETLGLVLSVHPLTQWEPVVSALPYRPVPASELAQHVGQRIWVLGWPITRKEVMTKEGEPMEFFSFEDRTAIYETVFFPKAFRRFCQDLDMDRAYLLGGRVESEFGTVSLNVQSVRKLKLLSP
jgi:DNA-directed DNA polymerase III PolC